MRPKPSNDAVELRQELEKAAFTAGVGKGNATEQLNAVVAAAETLETFIALVEGDRDKYKVAFQDSERVIARVKDALGSDCSGVMSYWEEIVTIRMTRDRVRQQRDHLRGLLLNVMEGHGVSMELRERINDALSYRTEIMKGG